MKFGDITLAFNRAHIMGILNVTPDSMSDGGRFFQDGKPHLDNVFAEVESMIDGGASFIDVGGESTRPGFEPVSLQEELDRVLPVLESINSRFDTLLSIDTYKPEVMREAVKSGARLINDVKALTEMGAREIAAECSVPVVLMHSVGGGHNLHQGQVAANPMRAMVEFFEQQVALCLKAGITKDHIMLDPGFGFGKKVPENIALMAGLKSLCSLGCPILAGLSRKKTISTVLGGRAPHERLAGGLALAVLAHQQGARIIRTHDVKETVDAIRMVEAFASDIET